MSVSRGHVRVEQGKRAGGEAGDLVADGSLPEGKDLVTAHIGQVPAGQRVELQGVEGIAGSSAGGPLGLEDSGRGYETVVAATGWRCDRQGELPGTGQPTAVPSAEAQVVLEHLLVAWSVAATGAPSDANARLLLGETPVEMPYSRGFKKASRVFASGAGFNCPTFS